MRIVTILILFSISAFCSDYYTLQLGAFSAKKNANRYVEELKHKYSNLNLFVMPVFGLYKVYVGRFSTYKEAKEQEIYLSKKLNLKSFINKMELDEDQKSKNLKKVSSKKRMGIQVLAVKDKDGLEDMINEDFEYDIFKKDGLYKLVVKCTDRKDCKEKLRIVRNKIDKNAFITRYSDSDLYIINKDKLAYNSSDNDKISHINKPDDSVDKADQAVEVMSGVGMADQPVETVKSDKETPYYVEEENRVKIEPDLDSFEVEFKPIVVDNRYFLYENKITNSKIDANGKKHSSTSSTNSLGFRVDIYDNYFLEGKIGTRSSNKYLIYVNGKKLSVKVNYPVTASANVGYKFNINNQELYKMYLYSALGTSITKKDVEVVDFNNVKYTDSSTYFDYSLSGGFMMNFYNNLLFKIGANRDFGNKENGVEFSLSYEF